MPNWDIRFLQLATVVSSWSKDPSTKTGAVIIRPDKSICSVGFNGFPKSMPDKQEYYADRKQKYSRIVHCEINALIFAKEPVTGYTLYTTPFASCDRCCVQMLQAGIEKFVFPKLPTELKERWEESTNLTKQYILESGCSFLEI